MMKHILDLTLKDSRFLNARNILMKFTADEPLPDMKPGQFVEAKVEGEPKVFLRRPISIHYVDEEKNELWLLVQTVGNGTHQMAKLRPGETMNFVLPLGDRGFDCEKRNQRLLLVGGGVGVAPLLYLAKALKEKGNQITYLLGGRTKADLMQLDEFSKYGEVLVTTEDGSEGEKGFVTQHSVLNDNKFDYIYTCGPTPMMKAVADYAKKSATPCEVSLENKMACGLGACLCCVTDTKHGHECVCQKGAVFDINDLNW
ncbi:MAG: dihydroorotate dehydrogenase electron transfer subunit [Paludibacteraceae bacterium]|nr:dihydroorotate dehydrogenase electron transfer subunit [Paludibacteraceae bacterium]